MPPGTRYFFKFVSIWYDCPMTPNRESPLFVKTYDFTLWPFSTPRSFKSQRFVLARRIEEAVLDFYDDLLRAAKDEENRRAVLEKASYDLERVKHYLRMSKDLSLTSLKQYEFSTVALVEIGRLLGGWIRKCGGGSEKNQAAPTFEDRGLASSAAVPGTTNRGTCGRRTGTGTTRTTGTTPTVSASFFRPQD